MIIAGSFCFISLEREIKMRKTFQAAARSSALVRVAGILDSLLITTVSRSHTTNQKRQDWVRNRKAIKTQTQTIFPFSPEPGAITQFHAEQLEIM